MEELLGIDYKDNNTLYVFFRDPEGIAPSWGTTAESYGQALNWIEKKVEEIINIPLVWVLLNNIINA